MTCGRSVVFLRYILVSSSNKTDRHVITEIVLKVAFYTIILTLTLYIICPLILYYSCCFKDMKDLKWDLKDPKFRILILNEFPGFLLYILYAISLPCFSVRFCQAHMVSEVQTVKGANTLNDC